MADGTNIFSTDGEAPSPTLKDLYNEFGRPVVDGIESAASKLWEEASQLLGFENKQQQESPEKRGQKFGNEG